MADFGVCSIVDCGKSAVNRRGWCWSHYARWRRHGDPLRGRAPNTINETPKCSVDGCDHPHDRRGFCTSHYYRLIRHGTPMGGGTFLGEPLQWIQAHINFTGAECLIWPYAMGRDDYGVVRFRGKQSSAPKVMCTLAHGDAPSPDHETAHSCGNGACGCINPTHIRWDSRAGNHGDKLIHGTHIRGERNVAHKLTEADIRAIRGAYSDLSLSNLSKRYGVSRGLISLIKLRKRWAWLD